MQTGYDTDRWVGGACRTINYTGLAWTIIIAIFLLNVLNPDCVGNVADALVTLGDLLAVGSNESCCKCGRGLSL